MTSWPPRRRRTTRRPPRAGAHPRPPLERPIAPIKSGRRRQRRPAGPDGHPLQPQGPPPGGPVRVDQLQRGHRAGGDGRIPPRHHGGARADPVLRHPHRPDADIHQGHRPRRRDRRHRLRRLLRLGDVGPGDRRGRRHLRPPGPLRPPVGPVVRHLRRRRLRFHLGEPSPAPTACSSRSATRRRPASITAGTIWTFYQFQGDVDQLRRQPQPRHRRRRPLHRRRHVHPGVRLRQHQGIRDPQGPAALRAARPVWAFPNLATASGRRTALAARRRQPRPGQHRAHRAGLLHRRRQRDSFSKLVLRRITNPGSSGPTPRPSPAPSLITAPRRPTRPSVPHLGNTGRHRRPPRRARRPAVRRRHAQRSVCGRPTTSE